MLPRLLSGLLRDGSRTQGIISFVVPPPLRAGKCFGLLPWETLRILAKAAGLGGSLKGTIIANELSSNPEDPMTKKLSRRNMVAAALFAPAAGSSVARASPSIWAARSVRAAG